MSLPSRLCLLWTATRENIMRKSTLAINLRYDLHFNIKQEPLDPGPSSKDRQLKFLSFNAQSIRSVNKQEDGTFTINLKSFLDDNIHEKEILPTGYNIIRKDRPSNKCGVV